MILLALNEINIDFVNKYIEDGYLKNFKKLLSNQIIKTKSEKEYNLLEPWIQWPTVHTGLNYKEHGLFRLGDIVNKPNIKQIFETLEEHGLSVGAISPFNARNDLKNSNFFIPDPWTKTRVSGGYAIKKLSNSISKFVNSNASGKVGFKDFFWLIFGFVRYVRISSWFKFFRIVKNITKPGVKAAILDMILLEIFVTLQSKYKPDYSHIFFNGVAHIQHHYLFNSSHYDGEFVNPSWYCPKDWDPLLMILKIYDSIIGDLMSSDERIVGVTGLSQVPHSSQTFYWRPINHKSFVKDFGVNSDFSVIPRMSRDFLIVFESIVDAEEAEKIMLSFVDSVDEKKIFKIDNRGKSLFVELVYSNDINSDLKFISKMTNASISKIKSKLAFVAIKNGEHNSTGYLFSNKEISLDSEINLSNLFSFIKEIAISDFDSKKS